MIKQIAAKTINRILSKHMMRTGFSKLYGMPSSPERVAINLKAASKKLALLPPIVKPAQKDESVREEFPESLLETEEGHILMGDVITLIAIESQDLPSTKGIITGDGIAQSVLDCASASVFVNTEKVQFRLSLFRIEPIRQYGYSNLFDR